MFAIFAYRALCGARGETQALPGFDEKSSTLPVPPAKNGRGRACSPDQRVLCVADFEGLQPPERVRAQAGAWQALGVHGIFHGALRFG